MATPVQLAANRRNAQQSTGPKTSAGRARSARNARSHGLTASPPPGEVLAWLRVILDDPRAEPDLEMPAHRAALRLAVAEAHLARVKHTAMAFLAERFMETQNDTIVAAWAGSETDQDRLRRPLRYKPHSLALRDTDVKEEKPLTLSQLERYRREAEARRRSALRQWIVVCSQT